MSENDWAVSRVITAPVEAPPTPLAEVNAQNDAGISVVDTGVKPPLSEYTRINNHPYTIDYFKMKDFQGLGMLYEAHYKPKIEAIENFVNGEIQHNRLIPTTDSYDQVMEKIFKYLEISKNDMPDKALEKILIYAKMTKSKRDYETKIKGALDSLRKYSKVEAYE